MRLRSRLTRTLLLTVALALVASGAADVLVLRAVLRHDFAQVLHRESVVAMRVLRRHGELPARLPAAISAAVYTTPGHALVLWTGPEYPPGAPSRAGISWSGPTLTVARLLPDGGGELIVYANGFGFVGHPLGRLEEVLLAVTLASLAAAWLVAARTARDLSKPLADLAVVATRVSDTADLETMVPADSNIVEVREFARAFNTMIARLGSTFSALRRSEQRERALREATAHDLYTPLATVLATLELLEEGSLGPSERERVVSMARREANRLAVRVDRTLGRQREARADVARVAEHILAQGSVVRLPPEPVPLVVAADPGEVVEVLDLLVDNAVRHNPAGTQVWVEWSAQDGYGTVTVRDDGRGIAPDLLPTVLERRRTGGDSPGLGLGLALARDVVCSRGGDLAITSAEGQGTEVTVRWPLA